MNSEPESDSDADEFILDNPRLYYVVLKFLNMAPTLPKEPNCNLEPLQTLKLRLNNDCTANSSSVMVTRASAKTDVRKKIETSFRDLSSDLQGFSQKLDFIFDCILDMLNRMRAIQARVAALEEAQNKPNTPTYSEAFIFRPQTNVRLEKFEYFSSEEERKRRINEVCVTHPPVSSDKPQSTEHLEEVLTSVLEKPGTR